MTLREAAQQYAEAGWRIFPCRPGGKEPLTKRGHSDATCDMAQIEAWWTATPDANIGLSLASSGVVAVDVDQYKGDCGWQDFVSAHSVPPTLTQLSPRGGQHLIFSAGNEAAFAGAIAGVPGVDIKHKGYILGTPSIFDGKPYRWADPTVPIAPAPDWLPRRGAAREVPEQQRRAELAEVIASLNAIPNHDGIGWEEWNRIGMAVWAATGGEEAGLCAFDEWSRKAEGKYCGGDTPQGRWDHYRTSPPTRTGISTLRYEADKARFLATPPGKAPESRQRPTCRSLPLEWIYDVQPSLDAADFVEGLLGDGGMGVVYGESNCGKTFLVTDLALHVALGRRWMNRAVDQGAVIYIAAEGGFGVRNRLAAFKNHYDLTAADTCPFYIVPAGVDLLRPGGDVGAVIDAAARVAEVSGHKVRLIVVDTLSRALAGGNENSPEDMGALVRQCDAIREATKAAVALVHHSGKDSARGARGHSLLRAATDTEIELTRHHASGVSTARVTKQRDMEGGASISFMLHPVVLGINQRGKPVTSCVVEASDAAEAKLSQHESNALNVLVRLSTQNDGRLVPVRIADWRVEFGKSSYAPGAKPDTVRRGFERASKKLQGVGFIGVTGDIVCLTDKADMTGQRNSVRTP